MKNVIILGASGNIAKQVIDILSALLALGFKSPRAYHFYRKFLHNLAVSESSETVEFLLLKRLSAGLLIPRGLWANSDG
jgi:hypothetical protein